MRTIIISIIGALLISCSGNHTVPVCNEDHSNVPCTTNLPIADSFFRVSDCPIIGQRYTMWGFECWHDCNDDGEWDRRCTYEYWEELERVVTIECTERSYE